MDENAFSLLQQIAEHTQIVAEHAQTIAIACQNIEYYVTAGAVTAGLGLGAFLWRLVLLSKNQRRIL